MACRTRVLPVDPTSPDPVVIATAADWIRRRGLVAFPTETVYGLGANALDSEAVDRIFEAKGRPANNPLIVHVRDAKAARALVTHWPESADCLTERFWPGPLTLVLPKSDAIPDIVTAGGPTVAVRAPANAVAQALLRAANVPIAAPSANRSGRVSPTRAEHVLRSLNGRIEYILDGGPTTGGIESTVLDLTAAQPRLLRPGLVTVEQIESAIGPLQAAGHDCSVADSPLRSPGMMARHYAPRARLQILDSATVASHAPDSANGILTFDNLLYGPHVILMQASPAEYAARLYGALHELDEAGVDNIFVESPPDSVGWLAIRDRLRRAAAD